MEEIKAVILVRKTYIDSERQKGRPKKSGGMKASDMRKVRGK